MPATLEGEFALVGTMARPAGVSGIMGGGNATEFYGKMLAKGSDRGLHALRTASPYAERAEPGWAPLEATTKPSWADRGAGTVSAGCIDNTYMPSPLKNKWGKQRELSKAEVIVLPHKQVQSYAEMRVAAQRSRTWHPRSTSCPGKGARRRCSKAR